MKIVYPVGRFHHSETPRFSKFYVGIDIVIHFMLQRVYHIRTSLIQKNRVRFQLQCTTNKCLLSIIPSSLS